MNPSQKQNEIDFSEDYLMSDSFNETSSKNTYPKDIQSLFERLGID